MRGPVIANVLAPPKPSFSASLTNSLVPEIAVNGTPAYSRSTTATVVDQDGIIRYCLSGEARFSGARRVQNTITASSSEKVSTWNLGAGIASVIDNSSPLGSWNASKVNFSVGASSKYVMAPSTIATVGLSAINSYAVDVTNVVTKICTIECWGQTVQFSWTSPTTISVSGGAQGFYTILGPYQAILYGYNSVTTSSYNAVYFGAYGSYTSVSGEYAYVTRTMQENVTGQTNQIPAEYVSVGVLSYPYHGCGADGVQYFPYLNGNTVSSGIVTAGVGATILASTLLGYLGEVARTNVFLNSAIGVTQNITVTAQSYTLSFYGTGSIALSGTATGTLSGTGVNNRVTLTFTPTAGTLTLTILGATTNVNLEAASFATSYIPTTSAAVTRNADALSYAGSNHSATDMTISCTAIAQNTSVYCMLVNDNWPNNNSWSIFTNNGNNQVAFGKVAGSTQFKSVTAANSVSANVPFKVAGTFSTTKKVDGTKMAVNGALNANTTGASDSGAGYGIISQNAFYVLDYRSVTTSGVNIKNLVIMNKYLDGEKLRVLTI